MGYRSALGVISLNRKYGPERVEAACTRAMRMKVHRYQSVKSMLVRGLDRQPLEAPTPRPPLEHDNLRGAAYFDPSDTPRMQ